MWKYLVAASLAALPTGPAFAQTPDYAASALNSPDVLALRQLRRAYFRRR